MANNFEIPIHHKITSFEEFVLIEFDCGVLSSDMLFSYLPPDPVSLSFSHKGVIIKGAMPLWFCAFLTHAFHATRFVAVFEPRIPAAIVIATHVSNYKKGDVIKINAT
jgi:CRISPR-associated Csx3 family protein